MNITNNDLEFLIHLENKLGCAENWSEDVMKLWALIEKLQTQRKTVNEKTREYVKNKRKDDPGYGRSKEEKDRITRRAKK